MAGQVFTSIPSFEVKGRASGELYTLCRSLSHLLGVEGVELMCEELLPGHQASAPHSHSTKQETHIILKGKVLIHVEGEVRTLSEGDCVSFGGGDGVIHYLENRSNQSALILTISTNHKNDVVRYAPQVELT